MNLPNGYLLQKGKYKLTQAIGQGGFGITYKGVWYTEVKGSLGAMRTEVPVCIKEYFFKDYCGRDPRSLIVQVHSDTGKLLFDKFKEKLIKEAKILSEVHHPYIVNVLEVFEENNTAYIAMEYISGLSLKDKLAQAGVFSEDIVLHYVQQIGEALSFVHQKNILHLDIKPSNILIDKEGKARLIDFGVSKRYDVGEQETSTTMLTLSKGFASVEQYDNEGILSFSPCPDIYSLGATMYNLLTGKIPTESILRATRPLVNPRELNPSITPQTEKVILKAMEIIPSDRYQTIAEMMADLNFPTDFKKENKESDESHHLNQSKDETQLLGSSVSDSEDETVLNPTGTDVVDSVAMSEPKGKKSKKLQKMLIVVTVLLFVAGGALFGWRKLGQQLNPQIPQTADANDWEVHKIPVEEQKPVGQKADSLAAETKDQLPTSSAEEQDLQVNKPQENREKKSPDKSATEKKEVKTELKDKEQVAVASAALEKKEETKREERALAEQTDVDYQRALTAAKNKMEQKNYSGALKDLAKAKSLKVTEEVVRLQIACDQEMDHQQAQDRKSNYIEMMSFGSYKVVRKKSNDRYGAIDTNGKEVIPCKYLSVGKAENGRAFEREDNLFDIYGSDGKVISQGATYY